MAAGGKDSGPGGSEKPLHTPAPRIASGALGAGIQSIPPALRIFPEQLVGNHPLDLGCIRVTD